METSIVVEGTEYVLEIPGDQLQARAEGDLITCEILAKVPKPRPGESEGAIDG